MVGNPTRSSLKDPLRFTQYNASFAILVQIAFDLREYQVAGGPDWLRTRNFDVEARTAAPSTLIEQRAMLQALLAERFGLKFHYETRDIAAYALVTAKRGPKIGPQFHPVAANEPPIPTLAAFS